MLAATGFGFPGPSSFWPRLLLAVVGTLNPSSGDVGVFLPLGRSRRVVVRLAALFSVDAFAGGLVVNALMALLLV